MDTNKTITRRIKDIVWNILNKIKFGGIIEISKTGYLKQNGWYDSFHTKRSVNAEGKPIPWCTYPFIAFIETRLNKNMNVFEYGCGNSTIWYSQRVGTIRSVEHDKEWYNIISKKLPENASVVYRELYYEGDYSKESKVNNIKYDIIIIDGRDRVNSVKNSIDCLKEDGIIVFDNSNLEQYRESIDLFKQKGFKGIDFWGMSPVTSSLNCTSIYYRENNILGI